MNRLAQLCSVLLVLLLFSCNIEKRHYSSGYYISSHRTEKSTFHHPPDIALHIKNEEKIIASEEKIFKAGDLTLIPSDLPEKKIIGDTADISGNTPVIKAKNKKPVLLKDTEEQPLRDDDEPQKDAKQLFLGSIGSFIVAMLYGLFLAAGMTTVAEIIFILIPFSVIGLWIWSLLLHNKYAAEDPAATSTEKKKKIVYSQRKAFLLAGFLGIFGAHRFYLGYPKMGMLEMFTLGGFFVLYFVDLIRIKYGKLMPFDGHYEKSESTYTRGKKNKVPNKTMRLIKWSLMISLLALLCFLAFAIFLAPSLV